MLCLERDTPGWSLSFEIALSQANSLFAECRSCECCESPARKRTQLTCGCLARERRAGGSATSRGLNSTLSTCFSSHVTLRVVCYVTKTGTLLERRAHVHVSGGTQRLGACRKRSPQSFDGHICLSSCLALSRVLELRVSIPSISI